VTSRTIAGIGVLYPTDGHGPSPRGPHDYRWGGEMREIAYVFGFASLLGHRDAAPGEERAAAPEPVLCDLRGYTRRWNVAMDNSVTLPGYKYYVDRATGSRPAVFVTFLNLEPRADATVNGVAFPSDPEALELLDERERNYRRTDVTGAVGARVDGRVYAYTGLPEALERFETGRRSGRAVISRDYHDDVRRSFEAFGRAALAEFDRTTEPPPCPLVDLERRDTSTEA
jgi:Gamma-glutamyl cyclotransferase, AIG2-like